MHKIWDIAPDHSDVELWRTDIDLEVEFTNISMMREYMIIGYVIFCMYALRLVSGPNQYHITTRWYKKLKQAGQFLNSFILSGWGLLYLRDISTIF